MFNETRTHEITVDTVILTMFNDELKVVNFDWEVFSFWDNDEAALDKLPGSILLYKL